MKCTKRIILTSYRVQYVDLRETRPRTPHEEIYIVDQQWYEAMGFLGLNIPDAIIRRYERGGFHAFSVQQIKPKTVVEVDLCRLWNEAEAAANTRKTEGAAE